MTNKKLLWFGLLCMIAAGVLSIISHVSGQTTNQTTTNQTTTTSTNQTNTLLKQILDQQKLQTQLTQLNADTMETKLDMIKSPTGTTCKPVTYSTTSTNRATNNTTWPRDAAARDTMSTRE